MKNWPGLWLLNQRGYLLLLFTCGCRRRAILSLWQLWLDVVILAYFNATLMYFYAVKSFICIYFALFQCFYAGECWCQRFKYLKNFNEFFMYLFRWRKVGCTNACLCIGTHSQPLLQNRLMDVYKTWQIWSNHGLAHVFRLFGQIRPEMDPRRSKHGSMRSFSKGLLLQIRSAHCTQVSDQCPLGLLLWKIWRVMNIYRSIKHWWNNKLEVFCYVNDVKHI